MLKHLHIENYALIESLDIDFHDGFSVITGETGAGKSILLGAIGLLTGDRADLSAIQSGKQRCVLEATFNPEGYGLEAFFQEEDLDFDPSECIIRRELTANGKSRAFINDTPTTITALKRLGNRLIDIHSQHQNLLLGQEDFQLSVLDTVAAVPELVHSYSEAFRKWAQAVKALDEAKNNLDEGRKDEDYLRFLLTELNSFKPQPGEDESLQQQCDMLEHAQDIKTALMQGYGFLSEGEAPVTDTVRQVRNLLSSIQTHFPQAEELAERIADKRTSSCLSWILLQQFLNLYIPIQRPSANGHRQSRHWTRLKTIWTRAGRMKTICAFYLLNSTVSSHNPARMKACNSNATCWNMHKT